MATNSTISCNWLSATDVVTDIQVSKLNATDIVAQCPNICQIVFESNNLDITQQGVRISLVIQVVLACLTGSVLPALFWLTKLRSWQYLDSRIPLMRKFRDQVWNINAFFSISLLLAICIRYTKNLPVIEIAYLSCLVNLESMITWTLYFGKIVETSVNGQKQDPRDFWYLLIAFAQFATLCTISISHRSAYQEMAKECREQHQFVDVSSYLNLANGTEVLKWYSVGIGAFLAAVIIIAVLAKANVLKKIWNMVPGSVKKHGVAVFEILFLGFYIAAAVSDLVIAEDGRDMIMKTSGDQTQNEAWGYAQTTAILIWFPVLWAALTTIKDWRDPPQDDDVSPSLIAAQIQVLRSARQAPPPPPYSSPKGDSRPSTPTSAAPPYNPAPPPPPPQAQVPQPQTASAGTIWPPNPPLPPWPSSWSPLTPLAPPPPPAPPQEQHSSPRSPSPPLPPWPSEWRTSDLHAPK